MDKQRFKEKNALAFAVAVVAFAWTWATMNPKVSFYIPSFIVFLTWASTFLAGGGPGGFKASLRMNITGALLAYAGIWLGGLFAPLGILALPIGIFIVCLPLCWLAYNKLFEITPCGFIGAASLFAVANTASIGPSGVNQVLLSTLIAIVLGNISGPVTERLIGIFMSLQKERV